MQPKQWRGLKFFSQIHQIPFARQWSFKVVSPTTYGTWPWLTEECLLYVTFQRRLLVEVHGMSSGLLPILPSHETKSQCYAVAFWKGWPPRKETSLHWFHYSGRACQPIWTNSLFQKQGNLAPHTTQSRMNYTPALLRHLATSNSIKCSGVLICRILRMHSLCSNL